MTFSYSYLTKGFAFWLVEFLRFVFVCGLTIVSAYFYPFSLWWYKQSFIGTMLNNIYHIGAFWVVILKILGTLKKEI